MDWKKNYQLWMTFVNEYKNRGGRVAIGSDSGYSYNLYGFGHVREMELLREAGFHPLEVFRAATLKGAEALGLSEDIGTIEVGKYADLVVVEENPVANIKVLYGTGAVKLDENNNVVRVGGVKYTIKDGIIFDARELRADVRRIVAEAKMKENFEITQPGRPTTAENQ
jgi:imidazolonepropionase-like amidohydrolase